MAKINYEKARRRQMGLRGQCITAPDKPIRKKNHLGKKPGTGKELWCWGTRYRHHLVSEIPDTYLIWVVNTVDPKFTVMRGCAAGELLRRRNKSPVNVTKTSKG